MAEKEDSEFVEDVSTGEDVDVSSQPVKSPIEERRTNDLQPKKEDLAEVEPGQEGKRKEAEGIREESKMEEKKEGSGGCCGS